MKRFMRVIMCGMFICAFQIIPVSASAIEVKMDTYVEATGVSDKTVTAAAGCTVTQIQRLLNENADGASQLTVIIPAGTYKLDRTLYVYPNTTIVATGATLIKQNIYGADWSKAKSPKEAVQLDMVHSSKEVPTNQKTEILNWDDLPCNKISISGCEFYQFSRGIGSHTAVAGRYHSNVTIQNNKFHDLSGSAIRLYNYKDTIVSNNTITNAVAGVLAYTYIEASDENAYFEPNDKKVETFPKNYNIQIIGNTIKKVKMDGKSWGDGIRVRGSKERPISGVEIKGNTITSAERYGIFVTEAPNVQIYGNNQVSTVESDGITLTEDCKNATIYGNIIKNTSGNGIAVSNSDKTLVYGNTILSPDANGIYLVNTEKCTIGGIEKKAGNTIKNAGKTGIWASSKSRQSQIIGNQITKYARKTKGYGIYVYQSGGNSKNKMLIQKNTITGTGKGSGKDGIRISDSSYTSIVSNKIVKAMGAGIYVYNSKNCTIGSSDKDYNSIQKPVAQGIYLTKGSNNGKIQFNCLTGIKEEGIGVFGSLKVKITGNTIDGTNKQTKNPGIKLSGSSYALLQKNRVSVAQGTGIYLYKSKKCTVTGNRINSPRDRGIYATTGCDGAKITKNIVKNATGEPISVYQSPGSSISGNKVTGKNK